MAGLDPAHFGCSLADAAHAGPPGSGTAAAWAEGEAARFGHGIALFNTALVTLGVFAVVPNISAYIQHNLAFPRGDIGGLYLAGGLASLRHASRGGAGGSLRRKLAGGSGHRAACSSRYSLRSCTRSPTCPSW